VRRRHCRWSTRGDENNAQATCAESAPTFLIKTVTGDPRCDREPGSAGASRPVASSKHGNFGGGLCVRWRQSDRGIPWGGLARSSTATAEIVEYVLSARPAFYPVRRETVPMPTPCSRAIARMLLPVSRAARIAHLGCVVMTVVRRPSRVPSAFGRASPGHDPSRVGSPAGARIAR
jgi:hypothetical protein